MKTIKKKKQSKQSKTYTNKIFILWGGIIVLISVVLVVVFGGTKALEIDETGAYKLSFANTTSNTVLNSLRGEQVTITGYMSTNSPLSGEFAYLMNLPYQNCPYCLPGTSELTNTLAIYAGKNKKIEFTDQLVTVVGTLETGNFSDEFGYEYKIRLNNVEVKEADPSLITDSIKKYSLLAESGLVSEIYNYIMMFDNIVYSSSEQIAKVDVSAVEKTKNDLNNYNQKGEYNRLVVALDELIKLANEVNGYIDNGEVSKVSELKDRVSSVYSTFADWLAQTEM